MIREASDGDLLVALDIHRAAFGADAEAALVRALLGDAAAAPRTAAGAPMAGVPADARPTMNHNCSVSNAILP
jgi:hypothetical protein